MHPADQANQRMVDALIAEGALWLPALVAAFRATPRHCFLDRVFQYQAKSKRWREVITRDPGGDEIRLLYSDQALITHLAGSPDDAVPISSSSQPSLMAQMLEDLQLRPGLNVLEVGAGTGYNAALLAQVIGPDRLTSIDVDRNVLSEAWDHLRRLPDRRVRLKHADGRTGFPDHAPYDRIMVTASTPDLEPAWLDQLAPAGIISAPLVLAPGVSYVVCGTASDGVFQGRLTRSAYFMPLRGEADQGRDENDEAQKAEAVRAQPAPWAGWFERRRPRLGWLRFIHALIFYAWLRGLQVRCRRGVDQQLLYGIRRGDGPCCWLAPQEWLVESADAAALAEQLFRAYLDAGGPWPTEYLLRADPQANLSPTQDREAYLKQGPRCQQVWELKEPRERGGWL